MIIESEHNDFKVKVDFRSSREMEIDIVKKAVRYMVHAMGEDIFYSYCANYKYKVKKYKWTWTGKKTWYEEYKGFWETYGLTQHQIYNKLMKGEEVLSEDGVDYQADIFLKVDRKNKPGVIGYTYPSTKWQWIYQRVLDRWTYKDVAGNLAHEWCHKMGFGHTSGKRKKHTIPYAVGYYVRDYLEFFH
jgi:hypothetical protein